ncbi:MAG: hypothetical protein ABSD82_14145, partial [Solirubrobacteraceae bacterium]
MLVRARDTLQRRALPRPRLTNNDHKPLVSTGDADRSLLLTSELTTTLRDSGRKQLNLGAHERLVDRVAANA